MHDKVVVVNSTPIIALLNIQRLNILNRIYGIITIPNAVKDEILIKNPDFSTHHKWVTVKSIVNEAAKETFTSVLHAGEVEVMILAKEINADL